MFAEFARRDDIIIRGKRGVSVALFRGGGNGWVGGWMGGQLSRIVNGCWWRAAVIEGDNCRGNLWIVKYRVVGF